jgi:hypothetical protein
VSEELSWLGGTVKNRRDYDIRVTTETMSSFRAYASEFGFAHLEDALSNDVMAGLRAEALAQSTVALPAVGTDANAYRSKIAEIGDFARSFLTSSAVEHLLQATFEQPFVLSEHASCYTYYGPGNFLSRHRDRSDACAVTLIVYLDAVSPDPQSAQTGLALRVFGDEGESRIDPSAVIPTRIGTLVAGRGSKFWHERPQLQPGEQVVALTTCFRAAAMPARSLI